jgi:hypothetical protein
MTIQVPEEMEVDLERYNNQVVDLLKLGLRQVKIEEGLALFRQGGISLWRAARLSGVSLREMTACAVARGLEPAYDEQMLREEIQ